MFSQNLTKANDLQSPWAQARRINILREAQHTPGAYPRHPQGPKWKELLHKLLVGGLGYVPGLCWKILRNMGCFMFFGSFDTELAVSFRECNTVSFFSKTQSAKGPWNKNSKLDFSYQIYGCFRKWWYPQIIHSSRVFHYKPSILGYPYFWKYILYVNPLTFIGLSLAESGSMVVDWIRDSTWFHHKMPEKFSFANNSE